MNDEWSEQKKGRVVWCQVSTLYNVSVELFESFKDLLFVFQMKLFWYVCSILDEIHREMGETQRFILEIALRQRIGVKKIGKINFIYHWVEGHQF